MRARFSDVKDVFFSGLPDFMEYGFVGILYLAENLYLLSRFSESVVAGVGVFEAIDNFPETVCVGFSFLVTAVLGTRVGSLVGSSSDTEKQEALRELGDAAKKLTGGAITGSLLVAASLLLLARQLIGLFLTAGDPVAEESAVRLTVSCALGFVFYMLNSELVCYYKIVGAYVSAHIMFFAESLLLPLSFKIVLGELFGVKGFCMGGCAGELFTFLLNLCIVWQAGGRFPLRLSDFQMARYLDRQIRRRKKMGTSL